MMHVQLSVLVLALSGCLPESGGERRGAEQVRQQVDAAQLPQQVDASQVPQQVDASQVPQQVDAAQVDADPVDEGVAVDDNCDGVDDDLDGTADEAFVGGAQCGVGACASSGWSRCVAGVLDVSCVPRAPAEDDASCGGVDDDCDGRVDEGFGQVVQVLATRQYSCALSDAGTVRCWGSNRRGALGYGDERDRGDDPDEMGDALPAIDLGQGRAVIQLFGGFGRTCAIFGDGTAKCWGSASVGLLGTRAFSSAGSRSGEMGDALPIVLYGDLPPIRQIVTGDRHTCALLEIGKVRCWGRNLSGTLGSGDQTSRKFGWHDMSNLQDVDLGAGVRVAQLAAGRYHTCALLDDGAVKCWGQNVAGQLGLGDTTSRGGSPETMGEALPTVDLGGGAVATQLTAGLAHTCALLDDGTAKCWGMNWGAALGLGEYGRPRTADPGTNRGDDPGEMGDQLPIVDVGGRQIRQVAAGRHHTCALLEDGAVKCWGDNTSGQLGIGRQEEIWGSLPEHMGNNLPAVPLDDDRVAIQISAGDDHTCVLLEDHQVKCWGANDAGQLGYGDTASRGRSVQSMGSELPVVDLVVSDGVRDTECDGVDDDCDGRVDEAFVGTVTQCGVGACVESGVTICQAGEIVDACRAGEPGVDDTCDLFDDDCDGRVDEHYARRLTVCGVGPCRTIGLSRCVEGAVDAVCTPGDPAASDTICDGVDDDCDGIVDEEFARQPVDCGARACSQQGFTSCVEGRLSDTCRTEAVRGDDETCDGVDDDCDGAYDEDVAIQETTCGVGACAAEGIQTCVDGLPVNSCSSGQPAATDDLCNALDDDCDGRMDEDTPVIAQVSSGWYHTCVLVNDGSMKCWGRNHYGQLGLGSRAGVRELECDWDQDCSGSWSAGAQQGDTPGEMGENLPTVELPAGRTATQISASNKHTCAVLSDGSVSCWGFNDRGQLGLGDTRVRTRGNEAIVDLGAGRIATQVTAGTTHSCALFDTGTVKCWGNSETGRLGLGYADPHPDAPPTTHRGDEPGEMGDSLPEVDMGAGRIVRRIVAGGAHTCALLDGGDVKCWGEGWTGALGLGHTRSLGNEPGEMGDALPIVDLGRRRKAIDLVAGSGHTCALLDDQSLKCWGNNRNGKLGYGDDNHRGDEPGEMGDALPAVDLGVGRVAVGIALGWERTCAVLDDATAKCWGADQFGYGAVGRAPGEMGDNLAPIDLGPGHRVLEIFVGVEHTCALLDSGGLRCWGANDSGQLGSGDGRWRRPPGWDVDDGILRCESRGAAVRP